jgi:peptidoglycan/LPS O-acetylase OafA/YrhL
MDGIAIGCLAGWLSERRPAGVVAARIAMPIGTAAVMLIIAFPRTVEQLGLHAAELAVTLLELGMALVLWAMSAGASSSLLSRGTSVLRAIGRCSYEIYLTHMFAVYGFFLAYNASFGKGAVTSVPYAVWYALILVLSVLLGCVVARWYSEPANRALRRWFAARRILIRALGSERGQPSLLQQQQWRAPKSQSHQDK